MPKKNKLKKYVLNNTRTRGIKNRFLITTDIGSFIALTKNEYNKFLDEDFDEKLFTKLEKKGILITKDNEQKIINDYRERNSFLFHGTSLHITIITLRCNQVCTYCQASRRPPDAKDCDMDMKTARKTVDFIFQSPSEIITIEFQGGEPLLNFEVVNYIIEYANKLNKSKKKKLRFSLVSNFTLLDSKMLDFFIKNRVSLCTSLDGPKELHDKNRKYSKGSGSYDDVVKGINLIRKKQKQMSKKGLDKKYRCIPNALLTVSRDSLEKHKEIIDEYVRQGFSNIFIRYMSGLGCSAAAWDKTGYNAEEFVVFYRNAIDYIVKNKIPIKERLTTMILKKMLTNKDPGYLDLRSPCGAAIGQLAYDHDGSVYSCDEGRMVGEIFKLGSVEQTYKDILCSDETCNLVNSSVNDIYLCDNCAYKPYCGVCPVCNYALQGNLIPKLAVDMRCRIFKSIFTYLFEKFLFDKEYKKVFLSWVGDKQLP